jgi:hypothetical protein
MNLWVLFGHKKSGLLFFNPTGRVTYFVLLLFLNADFPPARRIIQQAATNQINYFD